MTTQSTDRPAGGPWHRLRSPAVAFFSLVATPLLVFISSSTHLYLDNEALFQHQPAVLFPFLKLFLACVTLGLFLLVLSRYRPLRFALWVYYLAGPAFLVVGFLRSDAGGRLLPPASHETVLGTALWPLLLLSASLGLGFRWSPRRLMKPFAAFGLILATVEIWGFFPHLYRLTEGPWGQRCPAIVASREPPGLPNIYHVVLDAFQTDVFELALTPDTERRLGGFTYFPENRARYAYTPLSMASLYKGRAYAYDRTRGQFIAEAYNSRGSLLYWLKEKGYTNVAYIHGTVADVGPAFSAKALRRYSLFDRTVSLRDLAPGAFVNMHTHTFFKLWLYANVASPLRRWLEQEGWVDGFHPQELKLLGDRRLLTRSDPLISILGFRRFLDEEEHLPPSGRYTLLHLMLPHSPYELRADCSQAPGGVSTGPVQQSQCALKLMDQLIQRLKHLHRFRDSLILIHGDHGGSFRLKNGRLSDDARSRSLRALLLLKPIGATEDQALRVSDEPTSLLDIAPAIMAGVSAFSTPRKEPLAWRDLIPEAAQRIVPFIEGETLWSARRILERQSFQVGRVMRTRSSIFAPDTVIAQRPSPYTPGLEPRRVDLLLSAGHGLLSPAGGLN